jgi:Zn-dependent protease
MDFSPEQVRWIVQAIIILVLSICVHEWGHAIAADKLGDPTPRSQGRVTLNPTKHADPIGTLLFPLIALLATRGMSLGFGWGRPVQIQPHRLSRRFSMRTGHMIVALAGPMMNVVLGTAIAIVHVLLLKFGVIEGGSVFHQTGWPPTTMNGVLFYAAFLNFILFFFNLIPAPPLDGGAVLEGLLPERHVPTYQKFAVYGPFVLMAVIFIPGAARIFVVPAQKCVFGIYQVLEKVVL